MADAITVAEGGTRDHAGRRGHDSQGQRHRPLPTRRSRSAWSAASAHGSLTLNADGTFSYTHDGSENFSDSFTYRLTDNDGQIE